MRKEQLGPQQPWEHVKTDDGYACPTANLLIDHFGKDLGGYLLWNETCYPMSDEVAYDQAMYLIAKHVRGEEPTLEGWVEKKVSHAKSESTPQSR